MEKPQIFQQRKTHTFGYSLTGLYQFRKSHCILYTQSDSMNIKYGM